MQPYGPYTLTAGTLQQVGVPPSTTSVYIGNDSSYDVLVAFGPTPPQIVTQATGDYTALVQAMHHGTVSIPASYLTLSPQGSGGYIGSIWLLPLNTRASGQALTGTVSSLANAWVVALADGESYDAYSAPRQTDLSSQPRVIAVPVAATVTYTGFLSISASSTIAPFPGNVMVFNPDADGNTAHFFYIYSFSCAFSASWVQGQIQLQPFNDSGVAIGSAVPVYVFTTGGAYAPHIFTPPAPYAWKYVAPSGTSYVNVVLRISAFSASGTFYYNIAVDSDMKNKTAVPSIGYGYLASTYPFITNAQGSTF